MRSKQRASLRWSCEEVGPSGGGVGTKVLCLYYNMCAPQEATRRYSTQERRHVTETPRNWEERETRTPYLSLVRQRT